MTNKTQIADGAVCKGSLQLGSGCGRCSRCKAEIRSVFAKLEAAEARIAGIEKNLDAALYREKRVERQLLAKEAELAAMRGDAVPVAVVEWSDYIVFGQPPRVAVRELSPGALELAMGKSLFTHGQPAPVVVLDDATVLAWGERNYIQGDASKLRCMIEDAASLGLVKSADGEGD